MAKKVLGIKDGKVGYVDLTNPSVPVKRYVDIPYANSLNLSTSVQEITFEGDNTTERVFSDAELTGDFQFDKLSFALIAALYNKKTVLTASVGAVGSTTVTAGGSAYTSAPNVAFAAAPAGGRTATGHATVASGAVTAVVIDDPGAGYTSAPAITFSGGGGSGAAATSTLATLPAGIDERLYMGDNTEFAGVTVELVYTAACIDEDVTPEVKKDYVITIPAANMSPYSPGSLGNRAKQTNRVQFSAKKVRKDIMGLWLPGAPADGTTYFTDLTATAS